jgi:beta-glucosidase
MRKIAIIIALFTSLGLFAQNVDNRVDSIMSKMTIEQKIGQLNQMDGRGDLESLKAKIKTGRLTSVMNICNPSGTNELQRIAVEESPTGIPLLFARDVVHGFKTVLPIPLGQAASFDDALIQAAARNSAVEATECGIRWAFAPMMDIARDPRWGRIAEGFGEDTYLAGRLASAVVKGYQGISLSMPTSMAACAKHFACYGAAEGGRDYNTTYVPERLMRDVYLPPFKASVDAGCASVMASFNDNDGIPSSGNPHLLSDILRGEWGFHGVVVSDWGSVAGLIPHGVATDKRKAALKCITAGTDVDMSSFSYEQNLKNLIESGEIPMSVLDSAVRRVLRLKVELGLFEHPYSREVAKSSIYSDEILSTARSLAEESIVLLKNDGVLPLKGIKKLLLTGPMADAPFDQLGTWSLDGEKTHTITPLTAIKKILGEKMEILYDPALAYCRDKSVDSFKRVAKLANKVDAIVICVGEESIMSGEAHSLSDLNLQGAQSELVQTLAKTGKPIILVVMAGRPLTIGRETDLADAVLYAWHPGTMGGEAIANVLSGKTNPSGKLPVTFPRSVGQIPIYYNNKHTSHRAKGTEGNLDKIPREAVQSVMGHTSSYMDLSTSPLFPFGYGLSYTQFKIDNMVLDANTISKDGAIKVSVDIANVGAVQGTEVLQLYISCKTASVTQPVKQMKGYRRVSVLPGEKKTVTFDVDASSLAVCGYDNKMYVPSGNYSIMVGTDSEKVETKTFQITN